MKGGLGKLASSHQCCCLRPGTPPDPFQPSQSSTPGSGCLQRSSLHHHSHSLASHRDFNSQGSRAECSQTTSVTHAWKSLRAANTHQTHSGFLTPIRPNAAGELGDLVLLSPRHPTATSSTTAEYLATCSTPAAGIHHYKASLSLPFNLDSLFISFLFPLPSPAPAKQIIESFSFSLNYLSAQHISLITSDCVINVGQDSCLCCRHRSAAQGHTEGFAVSWVMTSMQPPAKAMGD